MSLSDILGIVGLVVALVAFGISFRWNTTNERTLAQLRAAIAALDARNTDLSESLTALQGSIADLDAIRHALGRAAMASTPESFVDLVLEDTTDGTTYGTLVELGRARLWGESTMNSAVRWLEQQGHVSYEAPLSHNSRVWHTAGSRSDASARRPGR